MVLVPRAAFFTLVFGACLSAVAAQYHEYNYNRNYRENMYREESEISCEHERRPETLESRKCTKACRFNSDCRGRNEQCLCDGKCGRSCIDPDEKCYPELQDIQHGRVEVNPYNRFQAMATYKCDDGYEMDGLPFRVCQGDNTWSSEPPRCKLSQHFLPNYDYCDPPTPVPHASHNGRQGQRKWEKGDRLDFTCDPGFKQSEDARVNRAWCVSGGHWVGPNLQCVRRAPGCMKPPAIKNGDVVMIGGNKVGAVLRYYCSPGYFITSSKQRVCQPDGTWNGSEPVCGKVVCGPPPTLENGFGDHDPDQLNFQSGHQVIYRCESGFYRNGNGDRALCSGQNGSWVGPTMTCEARDCGDPGTIKNGRRQEGYRFKYATSVQYRCDEGYMMTPGLPNFRVCQADGQWKNDLPTCYPVNCTSLSPPTHGTMIGSGTKFRTKVRFVCNNGFKVIGSMERTCMADGTWSGTDATCAEIDCGRPEPLYNGILTGHATTVGSLYMFKCNPRYKLSPLVMNSHCLGNGKWSQATPSCLGQCKIPRIRDGFYENGRFDVWVNHDSVVKPQCEGGLVLNDSRTMKCRNGTWTIVPRCEPAPCNSPPPLLENGHRVYFKLSNNARARYFCMAGYKLVGEKYMTCTRGKWTGSKPYCKEDYCPKPGTLKNGKIYKKGSYGKFLFHDYIKTIKHGDRLMYECNRNFRRIGPRGAACVNGQWSPREKPICVESKHPLFNKIFYPHQEAKDRTPSRMY